MTLGEMIYDELELKIDSLFHICQKDEKQLRQETNNQSNCDKGAIIYP